MNNLKRLHVLVVLTMLVALLVPAITYARVVEGDGTDSSDPEIEFTGAITEVGEDYVEVDGQTVHIRPGTEIEGPMNEGDVVKVHASYDSQGNLVAREIEPVDDGVSDDNSNATDRLDNTNGDDMSNANDDDLVDNGNANDDDSNSNDGDSNSNDDDDSNSNDDDGSNSNDDDDSNSNDDDDSNSNDDDGSNSNGDDHGNDNDNDDDHSNDHDNNDDHGNDNDNHDDHGNDNGDDD